MPLTYRFAHPHNLGTDDIFRAAYLSSQTGMPVVDESNYLTFAKRVASVIAISERRATTHWLYPAIVRFAYTVGMAGLTTNATPLKTKTKWHAYLGDLLQGNIDSDLYSHIQDHLSSPAPAV